MRSVGSGAIRRLWRGEADVVTLLLAAVTVPLAALFSSVVRVRGWFYDTGLLTSTPPPVPVVSIGNLAVGGTGKTPVCGWFVRRLVEIGRRPAIVMRGYGEDELLLHRRWNPGVLVIRAPRRIEGIRRAAREGADIVVLDDGFQHRAVGRDVDVVLLSPAHGHRPRILPRGPFRESYRALRRADMVLITAKGPQEQGAAEALADHLARLPGIPRPEIFTFLPGPWTRLDGREAALPEGAPLVVTSVAEPEGFAHAVAAGAGGVAGHLAFPDHHPFRVEDVREIARVADGSWIATTEKDAVKLEAFGELLPDARVLPLVPEPPAGLLERILELLPGGGGGG